MEGKKFSKQNPSNRIEIAIGRALLLSSTTIAKFINTKRTELNKHDRIPNEHLTSKSFMAKSQKRALAR